MRRQPMSLLGHGENLHTWLIFLGVVRRRHRRIRPVLGLSRGKHHQMSLVASNTDLYSSLSVFFPHSYIGPEGQHTRRNKRPVPGGCRQLFRTHAYWKAGGQADRVSINNTNASTGWGMNLDILCRDMNVALILISFCFQSGLFPPSHCPLTCGIPDSSCGAQQPPAFHSPAGRPSCSITPANALRTSSLNG